MERWDLLGLQWSGSFGGDLGDWRRGWPPRLTTTASESGRCRARGRV